ncbi:organic solute transporter Ostalpha-domain-containing protein [Infundibulicybe gibba]|nr:organic solute transporter Ostalpha-domain-containing protein [Infundibulicybe gibba]
MVSEHGSGAGSRLPTIVLSLAGVSTLVAVLVSVMSVYLHLKNYRKPLLQRMVIRIMIMVPLYAISSLISLFSVEAAFVIDAIRDIYEAFVIYCFFVLLLSYLGGERSLLILLHGRPPKAPVFPVSIFKREIDVSDPYTFLFLKRGILQYVQVKPVLAAATLILKACNKFNEGDFRANSGYLYVSIIYNTSICLSLYCLAMFWLCVNDDLKPFRPVPKFLCVKGILFFSFWQSVGISILVAAEVIKKLGPYTEPENISVGLNDTLICLEMPFFAIAHLFAFSYTDFIDPRRSFVARMPISYAFRDAFGIRDVVEDTKATLRGEGMDYREFEPSEGFMHQGVGRERRIRAGLRYSKGGKRKYWLPRPIEDTQPPGRFERGVNRAVTKVVGRDQGEEVYAPLLPGEADDIVHLAPDLEDPDQGPTLWDIPDTDDGYALPFGDLDDADEELFAHSKQYLFGDYNYPCIDISSEDARMVIWDEEERVLRDERGAWFSPLRGAKGRVALEQRDHPAWEGYGAVGSTRPKRPTNPSHQYHSERADHHGRIIDHDDARVPPSDSKDVKLKWTKAKEYNSRSASPSRAPRTRSQQNSQRNSPPAESSAVGANRMLSPPMLSRSHSRATSPGLPPDAVDLVVEDDQAAQEDQMQDRRKGEPAITGSSLKKVYKRGFVPNHDNNEPEDEAMPRAGEDKTDSLEDEVADGASEDGIIARAGTPPPHARVAYDLLPDDNPWG